MQYKHISKGICAATGFKAGTAAAAIKSKKPGRKDIALIYSEVSCVAAGVFTTNIFKAAPVLISQQHLQHNKIQAVVINSGNANACTGEQGLSDAKKMTEIAAKTLNLAPENIIVSSTGVIGVPLPMEKITTGISKAANNLANKNGTEAATAIMTTDTFSKEIAIEFELNGKKIILGGMAKGSGMICPNMATTLGFITCDANIDKTTLQIALQNAVKKTFNMISVDGDTSTNDMVLILANGLAQNVEIKWETPEYVEFYQALEYVLLYLAKQVVRDGEGATKLLEVQIQNAKTELQAQSAAKAICNSMLVKTALFGEDANWGRIVCALGYSGAEFNPDTIDLYLGDIALLQKGKNQTYCETAAKKILAQSEIVIKANLNSGMAQACAWGCDLSYDYVKINGAYRS